MPCFSWKGVSSPAAAGWALAAKDVPDNWDGLVRIKPKRVDAAFVAPGTDFRTYTKIMLDPAYVAFQKDWLRNINDSSPGVTRDVTQADAQKILEKARTGFSEVFTREFQKAGIELVNVVTGPNLWEAEARPRDDEEAWAVALRGLEAACRRGEDLGVAIGFEPSPPHCHSSSPLARS